MKVGILGYGNLGRGVEAAVNKNEDMELCTAYTRRDPAALTIRTDADRVPFEKVLRFPFTEDDFDDALTGLQCVTDYAMHEGYDHVHEDLFKSIALQHAEKIGVYEYQVNGSYMEYWSLFDEGFYFFRTDLNTLEREEVCHIHWVKSEGYPVPAFLKTPEGFTKYNYFEG